MKYVYLTNNIVTDQAQIDPFSIFSAPYAEQFIEAPDEVTHGWTLAGGEWIAPPVPPAPVELTPQEKLANAGLSVDELKVLLGIN